MNKQSITAGIFLNTDKKKSAAIYSRLYSLLKEYAAEVITVENGAKFRSGQSEIEKLKNCCSVVFAVGGDGTLLAAHRSLFGTDINILGVNAGRKGFLIELDEDSMENGVESYFAGKYTVEERGALYGCICPVGKGESEGNLIALNEFAITRSSTTGIIKIKIYVGGELTEWFSADGVLISTPTGSTAYSLSAGGPVVMPGVRCTLITPICAHSLHTRPFIAPDDLEVEVVTEYRDGDVLLIADGQQSQKIPEGYKAVIRKADISARFVTIDRKNMYAAFRDKMLEHTD